ncbi:MAG: hypothetical protein NT007_09730 [Candidatus Kapabacteria bacterium]|nr:hypothetical protein [Candidatus Kapabacteria bacterium]
MKTVKIDFEKRNLAYGNSVAIAAVKAKTENKASSLLDLYLTENHPTLGRLSDPHYQDKNCFYYTIVN